VKKLLIGSQVVILLLFIAKMLFLTGIVPVNSMDAFFSMENVGQAMAQTTTKSSDTIAKEVKDVTVDPLQRERDLFDILKKKQKSLEERENLIKAEEQKIIALKKEIVGKFDAMKQLESQLSLKLDSEKVNDTKRFKELARVYESAPPQKAAAMLEKLEVKTAAGITINMKRDRAGLIWGHLSPQKAVAITNEITKTNQANID
jgi:flagellar motility protein MotE (MotC chaperone)